jgi:hypothetical protein
MFRGTKMKTLRFPLPVILSIILFLGCTPAPVQKEQSVATEASATEVHPVIFDISDIPGARSHSLVTGPDGTLYVIYGEQQSLFVARSRDGGATFSEPVSPTGDVPVHVLPIERPAIAISQDGREGIAWLEMSPDFHGARVWYAVSENGGDDFEPPQLVTTELEGEVAMVDISFDDADNPVLAWLNGSELKFARSSDQGSTFSQPNSIGEGACECCQPRMFIRGKDIHIAYRSLEPGSEKGDIRDIVMIHSTDGGETFELVSRVSDEHWYLPACPIAGPSFNVHGEDFYIAWMDGRREPPGAFTRGDIWFARSQDDGKTFSPNVRINPGEDMHHTLPSISVGPGGRIHVAWEAQAQETRDAFLYYTFSDDGGESFAEPQVIADNQEPKRGNPMKPVIVVDAEGHVALAWLDRLGTRLARWTDTR